MNHYFFSDYLFIFFTFFLFGLLFYSSQNPFNKVIWHKLLVMPIAQISFAVIVVFWLLALLDCIHLGSAATILDLILNPLANVNEYSYSKPFAFMTLQPQIKMLHHKFILEPQHLVYVSHYIQHQSMVIPVIFNQVLKSLFTVFIFSTVCLSVFNKSINKNYKPFIYAVIMILTIILILFNLSKYFHILGTGQIGQDVFYQTIKSIRTGLMIGLFTSMIILPFALSLGLMAGYFGGITDYVIQYIYTLISSIPSVLLISAALLAWQFFSQNHLAVSSSLQEAENRLLMICVLLGLTNWAGLCRYIRAEVLKLRELDYIKAAKLLNTSKLNILFQHLLPNIMHMVIISIVLDFSAFVLAESVLTYIGIGVSPLTMSWGNMINAARLELARDPVIWWPLFAAFSFMFILVLACNFFADALRKALNPRE